MNQHQNLIHEFYEANDHLALSTLRKRPPPPSIWNLDRTRMVGPLKRPQNLVRGPYVDWFGSYCGLKIPCREKTVRFLTWIFFQPISKFFFILFRI